MENVMKEDLVSELKQKNLDLTREALENEEKYVAMRESNKSNQCQLERRLG